METDVRWDGQSVVVPAISAPSSVACLRSLGPCGIKTIGVSHDRNAPAFRSKYCDETLLITSPHESLTGYRDALLSLAERPDVGAIIPVREEDIYVLAKYRAEFAAHIATPWPTRETLAKVQDRVQLFEAAAAVDVPAPATHLLSEAPDWDREWIVKSRYGILADEYLSSYTPEQCFAPPTTKYLHTGIEPDETAIRAEMGHEPLLQEYVPTGHEYAFFALYDRGEALSTFQHRQIRGYSYAGGASALRESVCIPELEAVGRRLLDHLDWHGLAMVEFLRDDATGEFKLMEVNPRFWSSLPFSVQAGADFPYHYWLLANEQQDRIRGAYKSGIAGHLLRGELLYLSTVLTEDVPLVDRPSFPHALKEVGTSLVRHPRFDYLSIDDPGPFVRDSFNTLRSVRGRLSPRTKNRQTEELPNRWSAPFSARNTFEWFRK